MQRNFRADLRKVVAVALENGSWFIYLLNTPKAELGFNLFFISLHFYLFLFVYWKSSKSQVSKRVCPASYLENVGNGAGLGRVSTPIPAHVRVSIFLNPLQPRRKN